MSGNDWKAVCSPAEQGRAGTSSRSGIVFRHSCLVVDIGNTSTSLGRFEHGRVVHRAHVPSALVSSVSVVGAKAALLRTIPAGGFDGAIMASVAPGREEVWRRLVKKTLGLDPLSVGPGMRMPFKIDYPRPSTIGADRLANACGGIVRYGSPLVVADFGTALTFDIISGAGAYVGGIIAPGLPMMTGYLHEKTALLPKIKLGGKCPELGRSTVGAMKIGASVGYRGIVRESVAHIEKTLGYPVRLCVTGGHARWVMRGLDMPFVMAPDLTLFGLGCLYELNRRPEKRR